MPSQPPTPDVITLGQVLDRSRAWLAARGIDNPRLDADLLVAHALKLPERIQLYLQLQRPLSDDERQSVRTILQRRAAHEPVAWITGQRGFHALDLIVRPGVLVPRPDTETLVNAILDRTPPTAQLFLADVGCGSGAVGLALAAARPGVKLYATDLSAEALACTKDNVEALGLTQRVAVLAGNLLAPVPPHRPIDIVVSNPPYIPTDVIDGLQAEIRDHEPRLALDGGPDGLDTYRRLIPAAAARARIGLAVEIGHDQGPAVRQLFQRAGLVDVQVLKDLGRRDRVVLGTIPGASWPKPVVRPVGETHVEAVADPALQPASLPDGPPQPKTPALDEQGQPLPILDADR